MTNISEIIHKLYPQVTHIVGFDNPIAYDANGNPVQYDKTVVQAYIDAHSYIAKRQLEYPTIGDQLDALWKGGDAQTEMLAKVMAVKAKYPKEQV
jgi:hypothetical protein